MWNELFTAIGLMLVLEGIMPFLSPERVRRLLLELSQTEDHVLRGIGLVCMVVGAGLIYFLR